MGERRWGNFSSCCRLCLSEKLGTLKSIFEDASRSRDILKNIKTFLDVDIHADDKLSTMICEPCLSKVNSWNAYKKLCGENQTKLLGWMYSWHSSNIPDISIQIKDEVVEDGEARQPPEIVVEDDEEVVHVKSEPVEANYESEPMDLDIYDLPPPLTPHPPGEQIHAFAGVDDDDECNIEGGTVASSPSVTEVPEVNNFINCDKRPEIPDHDGRGCRLCDKEFSNAGNRRKHEAVMHRNSHEILLKPKEKERSTGQNHASAKATESPAKSRTIPGNEIELQKIQFAAGLQLRQRPNADQQVSIENMPLTKVEISYLDKCKTIVKMTETLTCACHDERFENLKDLYAHLKKQRVWFAMFTCYNCLITFGDRSSYMKHYCHCPKDLLQNLKRLSESPVDPEVKMRLYQSYKCIRCNCIFSFYEDFGSHFDVEHMEMLQDAPPYICICSTSFESVEDYKKHLTISCFLRYFCDICFGVFPSTEAFKIHCEKEHDCAEGDTLDAYDTFHKCRLLKEDGDNVEDPLDTSSKSLPDGKLPTEESDEDDSATRIKTRRKTICLPLSSAPQLEAEDPDYTPAPSKIINPQAFRNIKSSKPISCPICNKAYSSYHNMLRHYKLSHDESGKILTCLYCSDKFRLITELKEHEATVHGAGSEDTEESTVPTRPVRPSSQPSTQFKYSCPDCGDLFKSMGEWESHIEKHPKKVCTECGKHFTLQTELDQHRSAHLNIKLYRDAKTKDYKSSMVSPILICEICDKTFKSRSELRQHKLLHEKMPVLRPQDTIVEDKKDLSRKYSCIPCNKHYVSYGGIWDHNKKHHASQQVVGEYPRKCTYCPKMLSARGAWSNHTRMHERLLSRQAIPNTKTEPNAIVQQNRTSKARTTNTDDDESYYTCKKCFKVFSSKCNLRNHMRCHGINLNPNRSSSKTGKLIKTYWCDVCHQACQGYSELQEHKQEHLNEKVPKLSIQVKPEEPDQKNPFVFGCDVCTMSFSTNFALRRHMEKHEQSEEGPKQVAVYCKYCKIPFPGVEELNEHMTNEHDQPVLKVKQQKPSGRKFPCGLCKKVFDNSGALSSHQGWHKRGKFGKKILRSQMVKTMLNQMPKSSALKERRFQCFTCLKQFVNDTALQIHILEAHRNVNTTVLAMNCNSCKLTFESKSAYDTHMQLHQVVESQRTPKAHPCNYCQAGFSRSDTLNAHVRQHHKEYYHDSFKCTQCERVFDKQNALTIHLKVHDRQRVSGENAPKPIHNKNIYFCSICDVGFAIAKDLRTHVVTAHPF